MIPLNRSIDELTEAAAAGWAARDAYESVRSILDKLRDGTYRAFLNAQPTQENLLRYWAELRAIERLAQELLRAVAEGKKAEDELLKSGLLTQPRNKV